MTDLTVHHFGPDVSTVGGMATVIRLFTEHRIGADVVVAHPTWRPHSTLTNARLTAAAAVAIVRMPTGAVAHVHLSERGSFVREGALIALAHRRGLRTVATLHGASFTPFSLAHPRLASAVLRNLDVIACLDLETLAFATRAAPTARTELVPNPMFIDANAPPADATGELVLFAGEIGLRKGADVLHRAWQRVAERRPDARCLMVGPAGDFEPGPAPRLEVRAAVHASAMPEVMRSARVVALPSRAEGMPMVLTEAMSIGRPFVSTPVGGIPELAEAGGVLVGVGDDAALADRLTELLADAALARRLGEEGRRFCRRTRSVEVISARFRELYTAGRV